MIEDKYISHSLAKTNAKPIAIAKFNEPVFKMGEFQDRYIEVNVKIYPLKIQDPKNTNIELVGIQFGTMNVIRYVDPASLYDVQNMEDNDGT